MQPLIHSLDLRALQFRSLDDINGASEAAQAQLRPLSASDELFLSPNAHLTFLLTNFDFVC